jgi:hypothetical protein
MGPFFECRGFFCGAASAQGAGAFSYQKQWWPQAVATSHGYLGSGAAYAYAGPSGADLWNDPRAWWPDYQNDTGMGSPSLRTGKHRR